MPAIVFLNGPPRAGKDTLGMKLVEGLRGFGIVKFAWELKERTHALYGDGSLPHDHFEDCKDEPNDFFMGLTPRQAYIAMSERLMKPMHGDQIFGNLLLQRLTTVMSYARGFLITDSGFESEALPLIQHFGSQNCLLVRIHRGTFANDSRSYLSLPIRTIDVHNFGTKNAFLIEGSAKIDQALQPMLAECA